MHSHLRREFSTRGRWREPEVARLSRPEYAPLSPGCTIRLSTDQSSKTWPDTQSAEDRAFIIPASCCRGLCG